MHSSGLNNFLIYFRVFRSLPIYSQHLLVLLIGTFRVIHSNSERAKTGMTAEALGVSVAPSFFHTCVSEGSKIAKPDEVQKFKVNFMINISRQNIIPNTVISTTYTRFSRKKNNEKKKSALRAICNYLFFRSCCNGLDSKNIDLSRIFSCLMSKLIHGKRRHMPCNVEFPTLNFLTRKVG